MCVCGPDADGASEGFAAWLIAQCAAPEHRAALGGAAALATRAGLPAAGAAHAGSSRAGTEYWVAPLDDALVAAWRFLAGDASAGAAAPSRTPRSSRARGCARRAPARSCARHGRAPPPPPPERRGRDRRGRRRRRARRRERSAAALVAAWRARAEAAAGGAGRRRRAADAARQERQAAGRRHALRQATRRRRGAVPGPRATAARRGGAPPADGPVELWHCVDRRFVAQPKAEVRVLLEGPRCPRAPRRGGRRAPAARGRARCSPTSCATTSRSTRTSPRCASCA